MVLFSLGASLLSGILIRPLVSQKPLTQKSILLLITLLVAMFILSATATAASHKADIAALTMSIILTVVGRSERLYQQYLPAVTSKENWQFWRRIYEDMKSFFLSLRFVIKRVFRLTAVNIVWLICFAAVIVAINRWDGGCA